MAFYNCCDATAVVNATGTVMTTTYLHGQERSGLSIHVVDDVIPEYFSGIIL